jgi:hypothetical protein
MKPIFIELTMLGSDERKFMGNINLLQAYARTSNGKFTYVIGWSNNGGFDVKESYEEVTKLIEKALKNN